MTEETPIEDVDKYRFPDKYFSKLREYEGVHEGYFSIVQGGLYRALTDPVDGDDRFTDDDADEIAALLNRKRIDEAEDMVYEVLDDGQGY